jgi:hypothetical protein
LNTTHLDRRDFSRWSLAALGGTLAGTCALAQQAAPVQPPQPIEPPGSILPRVAPPEARDESRPDSEKVNPNATDPKAADAKPDANTSRDKKTDKKPPKEIHICRGLNSCAGQGAGGENKCAGQGTCATTPAAPHECTTGNFCKGQGGCGPTAGKNKCKGYGEGAVPILEEEWGRLRKEFEARMKRLGKKIGVAPLSPNEQEWEDRYQVLKAKAEAEQAAKEAAARDGKKPGNGESARKPADQPGDKDDSKKALDEVTGNTDKDKK